MTGRSHEIASGIPRRSKSRAPRLRRPGDLTKDRNTSADHLGLATRQTPRARASSRLPRLSLSHQTRFLDALHRPIRLLTWSVPRGRLHQRHSSWVYCMRIMLDAAYPGIVSECCAALESIFPSKTAHPGMRRDCNCVEVSMWSKHWPCFFPQHGPGRKATLLRELRRHWRPMDPPFRSPNRDLSQGFGRAPRRVRRSEAIAQHPVLNERPMPQCRA